MLLLRKIPNYLNKVTINTSSSLYSNYINSTKPVYLPNSTHQTPTALSNPSYYLIELKEQLTGKVYNTPLSVSAFSSNSRYITFDLYITLSEYQTGTRSGLIDLPNGGKYNYSIFALLENVDYPATEVSGTNKNARFLIDKGLAMVYDDFDFTNNYFNPDRQVIPPTISFKNE